MSTSSGLSITLGGTWPLHRRHYLRQYRCLVILDNVEMLLQGGEHAGQYSPGYEGYGELFEKIAECSHQSCLLLTSREKTPEIARLESKTGPVRSLEVRGLHYSPTVRSLKNENRPGERISIAEITPISSV